VFTEERPDASRRKVVMLLLGFEKPSKALKETFSSVMPGYVCSESHNSATCFQ
jgi:hypothetical protein